MQSLKFGSHHVELDGFKISICFYAGERTCPPAGGAVPRENTPPGCFLTRGLQVLLIKDKKIGS
jgi:hypothetical protein